MLSIYTEIICIKTVRWSVGIIGSKHGSEWFEFNRRLSTSVPQRTLHGR